MAFKGSVGTFLLLLMATCSYTQKERHFFRHDYTYLKETKNFYKIHTVQKNFDDSLKTCELEGASMFYPKNDFEAKAVVAFWKRTQSDVNYAGIGVSSSVIEGLFETIDGKPLSDVYNKWAPGEPNNAGNAENCVEINSNGLLNDVNCAYPRPFICRKTLSSLKWNYDCDMPDQNYQLEESTSSCYKFHLEPKTWQDAFDTCQAEQSYLAIINSENERQVLERITAEAPKDCVEGNYLRGAVNLGFFKDSQGWVTVKGKSLQDSGYARWAPGQPDNAGGNETCGSMFYSGLLNDLDCGFRVFFICERDMAFT